MTRTASSGRIRLRRSMSVVINMKAGDAACDAACENHLRGAFEAPASDVLYDDTDDRAGTKFATADLIGMPLADHRRPARGRERRGGTQGPQDRCHAKR